MSDQPDLPYPRLPDGKQAKIRYLARLIRVEPIHFRDVPHDKAARALVGVVLYHHVGKSRQREIHKLVQSLPGPARMRLSMRITDTLVNRSWGVWSVSTEELRARQQDVEMLNYIAASVGLSLTGKTLWEVLKSFLEPRNVLNKTNAVLSVVIGGFFLRTERAERRMEEEIDRRRPRPARFQ